VRRVSAAERPIRLVLVPHTHWDREWYEPFRVFSERLVAMMDALLDACAEGFPHFHLDGQTAMVDDYLERRPDREPDLRRMAGEGRLSLGPWVTQMDEFLASGESHIRNLERGLARARELGAPLEVGYMPDQFGHIGQMPQLLRLAGIDRAVVWRGVPDSIDRDVFVWEAPDGSSVVCDYMVFGYFNGEPYRRQADPEELARAIEGTIERQRPFLASDRMLVMVGADHSGPDPTLPGRVEAAAPHLRGASASIGGIADLLPGRELPADLPVWRGELRSSARAHLLPNVYSARVNQKRERGRVESLLERYAEPLAALVPDTPWPADELDRAWLLMLWNGAHDSACGCSHDEVARDVDARFAEARAITEAVTGRALAQLASRVSQAGTLAFNPSPFERDGVPGLGWRVDPPTADVADVSVGVVDGGVAIDGVAVRFDDEPDVGDLYNFCPATDGQVGAAPDRVSASGGDVEAVWDDGLAIRFRVTRRAGEPFLRLEGAIENGRPDHRLRLLVDLGADVDRAVAGAPFELVDRGLVSEGGEVEAPSPTWPARHVVLAGDVAVLHDGVFEYEVVGGRELAVTLLRCVGTISRDTLATRPFRAGPAVPTPGAQMIGETPFALGIWTGAERDLLLRGWEIFALPFLVIRAPGGGDLPSSGSLLQVGGGVELSNVRRVDGAVEVRVWNRRGDAPAEAVVAGRSVWLGPAEIRTERL
jgi:hypothetical protein